jgi:hypothetical protein
MQWPERREHRTTKPELTLAHGAGVEHSSMIAMPA